MSSAALRSPKPESSRHEALRASADALRRLANYRLPSALQRKLRRMLEDKESLTSRERRELSALVELAQEKSLEKVKARVALELLQAAFPEVMA
jgi:hypothetical protein